MIYAFRDRPDFTLLVGPEEMMASTVLMGGYGGVSGGANIFPKLFVDLYNAADKGDLKEVARLQEMVMEIADEIYAMGSYGSSFLKGLKASMSILGIGNGYLATPLSAFENDQIEAIKKKLIGLKAYEQYA
jgi:4-hydroxy-tetrahydrodipicolinate synthase